MSMMFEVAFSFHQGKRFPGHPCHCNLLLIITASYLLQRDRVHENLLAPFADLDSSPALNTRVRDHASVQDLRDGELGPGAGEPEMVDLKALGS